MRSISGVGSHDNKAFGNKGYCMFGVRHGSVLMPCTVMKEGLVSATARSQPFRFRAVDICSRGSE
jgi:hypothetical protein